MELDIGDGVRMLLRKLSKEGTVLTHIDRVMLRAFAERVVRKDEIHQFNIKLINLKRQLRTEFPDGCNGINCSDCALVAQGTSCILRPFIAMMDEMEG